MEPTGRRASIAAAALLCATTTAIALVLHWPLPTMLRVGHVVGAFHDGHVWAFDHVYRLLSGQVPFSLMTDRFGYPEASPIRLIAWVPALLAVPLQPLLGTLGAYNTVLIASPALSALAAWVMLRRVTGAGPWTAAAAALTLALCPFALGSLANGQIAKFHLWVLALPLMAADGVVRGPHRVRWLVGLAVAMLASSFTSPSLMLFLPFVLGLHALWAVATFPGRRARHAVFGALALALAATAMLPAWRYYGGGQEEANSSFAPGVNLEGDTIPEMAPPMAMPREVFVGGKKRAAGGDLTNHVVYLGLPLLVVAALLSLRRFQGRSLAWAAVATGVVLALGPRLVVDGEYVLVGGNQLALPAYALDALGYPLANSGMYYRAISVAALGLAIALAGGCGRWRRGWAVALAWLVAAVAIGDGVRETRELWPRRTSPLHGDLALAGWAHDPVEGAVLDLPLATSAYGNGVHMLGAALHGRSTTSVPRATSGQEPRVRRIRFDLQDAAAAADPAAARQVLFDAGYRYVAFRPWIHNYGWSIQRIERTLGPPSVAGQLRYWRLGDDSS